MMSIESKIWRPAPGHWFSVWIGDEVLFSSAFVIDNDIAVADASIQDVQGLSLVSERVTGVLDRRLREISEGLVHGIRAQLTITQNGRGFHGNRPS